MDENVVTVADEALKPEVTEKSRFGVFVAGLAMILFTLGLAACIILWKYAQLYEATVPEPYMSRFMHSLSPDDWKEYLFSNINGDVSEFEEDEQLFGELYDTYLSNTEFTWRLNTAESDAQKSVYTVSAGNIDLCKVTLVPPEGEKLAFGRHTWEVDAIIPCSFTERLENITVEIDAPEGREVFVNGKELNPEYIVGQVRAPFITELEERIGTDARFTRYRIENVYGAIDVTDSDGKHFSCVRDADVYRYIIPSEDTYSFVVEAPEGVRVSVCGAELEESEATGQGEDIFEGFDRYTGDGAWKTLVYSQSGLYAEPVVTAVDVDGNELVPFVSSSGKIYFFLPEDGVNTRIRTNYVRAFFIRYASYATKTFRSDDTDRFDLLMSSILPGTELFRYVGYSTDAMAWASYTNIKYDEITYEDIRTVGKRAFFCTVRFSADITSHTWEGEKKYSETEAYEMLFVSYNNGWYAAAMSALQ